MHMHICNTFYVLQVHCWYYITVLMHGIDNIYGLSCFVVNISRIEALGSRNSVVSVRNMLRAGGSGRGNRSLLQIVQTGSGAHAGPLFSGYRELFPFA